MINYVMNLFIFWHLWMTDNCITISFGLLKPCNPKGLTFYMTFNKCIFNLGLNTLVITIITVLPIILFTWLMQHLMRNHSAFIFCTKTFGPHKESKTWLTTHSHLIICSYEFTLLFHIRWSSLSLSPPPALLIVLALFHTLSVSSLIALVDFPSSIQ